VRRRYRFFCRAQVCWSLLLVTHAAYAGWEFSAPADPYRYWNTSVTVGGQYDDNFNSTEKNRESGVRFSSDIRFRATVPLERFLAGVQYDYGVLYPRDTRLGGVEETHNVTVSANCTITPELTLGLSETYINSLQPELVEGPANAPINIVQAGTYVYNNLVANVNYALSRRWILSVAGAWDTWRYQVSSVASNNDHDDYSTIVSALYALDPRTSVGLNYRYVQTIFVNPGPFNGLNTDSDTGYLSIVRQFNPELSLTLNGGYTIQNSENGTTSTSPSAYGDLTYNYGTNSTLSLTVGEALSSASLGVSQQFSSQENTTFALHAEHRFTPRLRALADLTYVYSSFTSPLVPGVSVSPTEEALTSHIGLRYAFREWLSAVLDYTYTQLTAPKTSLFGRSVQLIEPYNRNQVSLGMTLTY